MSHSTSTTSLQQQGVVRGGVIRSRRHSVQQRQFRRNYGVTSSHGDGQTLLPITSANNQTNSLHRLNANNSSSPESSHRPPTSTSTTTNNNHQRTNVSSQLQQDGAEGTDTVCQVGPRAT